MIFEKLLLIPEFYKSTKGELPSSPCSSVFLGKQFVLYLLQCRILQGLTPN